MELSMLRERILDTPLVRSLHPQMRKKMVMLLLSIAETEEVTREQKLFVQGDVDVDKGCLILEGMVRVATEGTMRNMISAPDILGEVQLFTPKGERTATVEVVVGGEILTFGWHEFGSEAQKLMSKDEMSELKRMIKDSAWTRDEKLLDKIKDSQPSSS